MKKFNELSEHQKEDIINIIKDVKKESIVNLYDSIVNIINTIDNKGCIEILQKLPQYKPIYSVQTLFDILREFSSNAYDVQGDFIELRKYIGMEIDVFMIVNMMMDSK
jgi:hypothetical protein